ncbi:STAS domain-containing protein [bacterium CPR1]|nr:STAS domain-containing protein [bacterium CPR1]
MRFSKGELFGGLTAAVIALPLALAFGVATMAPLGPEYVSTGALAGLYGAIFTGIFAALLGGTPGQVTGPTGPMTVVLTGVIAHLMKSLPGQPELVLGLAFLCVVLGGASQIVLGLLGFGRLIKYIPYPVIAGFMNGIAVIIFLGQMRPLLGLTPQAPLSDWQPATLLVGILTVIIIFLGPRLIRQIPASLLGLMLGTAAYYLVRALSSETPLGPVIGQIPSAFPQPRYVPVFLQMAGSSEALKLLPLIVENALTLGLLGAIDSLLTSVVADTVTRTRHDSRRELIGQGIGNLVAGCFGGLAGAGATVRTLINLNAGGRGRLSGVVHGLVLLLIVVAMGPVAGGIPQVVLAAILLVTAIGMIDRRSRVLVWKVAGTAEQKRAIVLDLAVVLLVSAITVMVDLILAVAVGMLLAGALFIRKMGRSVIRRHYRGDQVRSRRSRLPEEDLALEKLGNQILVLELTGPLFFGSADHLATTVQEIRQSSRLVILDLRQVSEIDSSGARVLQLIQETLQDCGCKLALASLREPMAGFLRDMDVLQLFTQDSLFPDADHALEWAENLLLAEANIDSEHPNLPLNEMELSTGLSDGEVAILEQSIAHVDVPAGELIVRQGDAGDSVYVLMRGHATIRQGERRLFSYGPGASFGEMALLEARPRSADVLAETDCQLYRLDRQALQKLMDEHPRLAMRLLWNLSKELSFRLRSANADRQALEGFD